MKSGFNKFQSALLSVMVKYPSPKSLSYFWNGGSMLGFVLVIQIMSGILLVLFYIPHPNIAFNSIDYLSREVWFGFVPRSIHLMGATLFSLFLYLHTVRGLSMSSFLISGVWWSGTTMLLLEMATAFFGYVLPWGQMSLWGATVITNLISAIPIVGNSIVLWVWGSFNLGSASLSFFFMAHFLTPFVILLLVIIHLILLHETSSTSSIQIHESYSKIKFAPYFISKDMLNIFILLIAYGGCLFSPWVLGDPENWVPANSMVSPIHIQPEWYFLYAYEILRSVPNKLGGVICLVLSVIILYPLSTAPSMTPINRWLFFSLLGLFLHSFIILTWLGSCSVMEPFILLGKIYSVIYFLSISLIPMV